MKACTKTAWIFCLYVGVVNAAWSLPSPVSATDGSVCNPQVGMDSDGNAVAVWVNFGETNWSILSSTKLRDGCWQNPSTILSAQDRIPSDPQLAVDPSGNAVALWVEEDSVIHTSERSYGGDWVEDPATISLSGFPWSFSQFPRVIVDADGNAAAVWKMFNEKNFLILASMRPCGYVWQTIPDAISDSSHDGNCPQIAVDPSGNAVAVWQEYDGKNLLIKAAQKPFGGSWQSPAALISQPLCDSVNPRVIVDAAGTFTVVWECFLERTWAAIQASQKSVDGSWTTPEIVSKTLSFSLNQEAQLAVDGEGNVMVVWTSSSKEDFSIQCSLQPKGGSWQEVPDRLSLVTHDAFCPKIGFDANGNAVAAWLEQSGYGVEVAASVKPSGGGWQSSPDILSAADKNAGSLQFAVSSNGTAVAVWREVYRNSLDMVSPSAIVSSLWQN